MKTLMKKQINFALGLGLMTMVSACGSQLSQHGNSLDPAALERLEIGNTKQIEVEAIFGKPSARGAFDSGRIYYISQVMVKAPAKKIALQERTVVTFSFDDNDVLTSIEFTNEDDGRSVYYVDSTTPTPGDNFGFFEQILSNINRPPGASSQ
jgi:outer membrane protein assembly factor BamE (lipoprotein component of BamABCDE complex)